MGKSKKAKIKPSYYVYILKCADGTFYTGYTINLEKRLTEHNGEDKTTVSSKSAGARYTRSRRPVKLVYQEKFSSRNRAMSREYAIKQMKRLEKLQLLK